MADPYIPPRPATPGVPVTPAGIPTGDPRGEYTRTTVNVGSAPVKSGNGFATGLLVAAVFVVVAILAYSFLGTRDDAGTGVQATPSVSIENNAAPAEPAPDAVVPDAAVPDAVVPDAAVPEAVTPDAAAPDAAAPDAAAPEPVVPAPDATAPAAPANP